MTITIGAYAQMLAHIITVTIVIFSLMSGLAWADKVHFLDPKMAGQFYKAGLSKQSPKLLPRQIEERVQEFEQELTKIHEALKPAPTFAPDQTQFSLPGSFYYQGRILKYIEGQRGPDRSDPTNFDKILFEAHGENGGQTSPQPVLISTRFTPSIYHEVDTPSDFSYRFSNRHELLGEPFGSSGHRDSLFQLFDPDGDTGLYSGREVTIKGQVVEGRMSKYLLNGPLSQEVFYSLSPYGMNDPRRGWISMGNVGLPGRDSSDPSGQVLDYLRAMVRTKRYPGFDRKVGDYAANAVGILCGLAHGTPSLVSPELRNRVSRSVNVGLGCYTSIINSMMSVVRGESFSAFPISPQLPVSQEEVVAAALEVMQKEDFFQFFLGAEFLEGDDSPFQHSMGMLGGHTTKPGSSASRNLQYHLAKLAFDSPGHATLAEPAKALLVQWLVPDPNGDPQFQEDLETDRRYFRLLFYEALLDPHHAETNENWRTFARKHFCTHGWGHPVDVKQLADRAFYTSTRDPRNDEELKALIYENRLLLAAILQTEARTGSRNSGVTPPIEKMIGFMKIDWEKGFSGPSEADFLKIFPQIMEQNACAL